MLDCLSIKTYCDDAGWIYKPFIPKGEVTVLKGHMDYFFWADMVAGLSKGEYPPGKELGEPITTFFVPRGDMDEFINRFLAKGGDENKLLFQNPNTDFCLDGKEVEEVVQTTGAELIVVESWTGEDMPSVEEVAKKTGAAVVVIKRKAPKEMVRVLQADHSGLQADHSGLEQLFFKKEEGV